MIFGSGIAPGNVRLSKNGTDLVLAIGGTGDKITIGTASGEGIAPESHIQIVEFADGTAWDAVMLASLATAPSGFLNHAAASRSPNQPYS